MSDPAVESVALTAHLMVFFANVFAWAYTLLKWSDLPAKVPIHFNITGRPDWWAPRPAAWLTPAIGSSISILMALSPQPDWKFHWLRAGVAVVFAFLQWTVVRVAMKQSERLNLLVTIALLAAIFLPMALSGLAGR
jgi:hypothetical protein